MKRSIYFFLYFSEGAPIGFIWWALPALLEKTGVSITEIATLSAVATLPWTLKFLLAPMVDILSLKFLKLKRQIFLYQLFMGISIFFVPMVMEQKELGLLTIVLIFHGFFAALQDICIDALAIRNVPAGETGKINGIMQAGMLVGRSILGGAGVFIAAKFGVPLLVYFLISCIWISLIALQRTSFEGAELPEIPVKKYALDFRNLIRSKRFWYLIGLTYFACISYSGISTISSAVLSEKGVPVIVYGVTYSIMIPVLMMTGALFGGYLSDRKNSLSVLRILIGTSIITSIIAGTFVDYFVGIFALIGAFLLFYFFIGAVTAGLYGFLMKNTSKEFAALEYSVFMAFVNLSDTSASYLIGQLVENFSYISSTCILGALCVISFRFLALLKNNTTTAEISPSCGY